MSLSLEIFAFTKKLNTDCEVRDDLFKQTARPKVWDAFGHVVGKLDDLLVDYTDQAMPPITALAIRVGSPEPKLVDSKDIATLWPSITLNVDISRLDIFQPAGHELYLKQRVLDQQIVDTEGKRLVRVNDLQIARKNNRFYLTGVDVGGTGLLRRLGLRTLPKRLPGYSRKAGRHMSFPGKMSLRSSTMTHYA